MRKNPDNRYATMFEVLSDLECVSSGLGEVCGAQMQCEPDEYWPRSEQGKHAFEILAKLGASTRSTPVPEEKSLPMQSGVRTSESGIPEAANVVETAAG